MRTSNRFAILAAIAAAPLLAIAAPGSTASKDVAREAQESKATCQRACNCHAKASAKAETGHGIDFFRATEHNAVP